VCLKRVDVLSVTYVSFHIIYALEF